MMQQIHNDEQPMTPAAVVEHFRTSKGGGVLQAAAKRADFDLRGRADERAEEFLAAMAHVGLTTLTQFDEVLDQYATVLPTYFEHIERRVKSAKKGETRASYPFMGELVLVLAYPERFDVAYLTRSRWSEDVVELVLRAAQAVRGKDDAR
ncbi:hypothetical protein [Burkholderia gladioli]|uniref:hypothetical protein n=1 Tax=Burkholderia gladioli TaxID=28095 RepID=UPI00163E329C|nr:hypothetical protein [Burkholderia gladioli]